MLPATVLFLVLLAAVHLADPDTLDRPLSMLRDGPWPAAGYALFALLGVVGVLHVRAASGDALRDFVLDHLAVDPAVQHTQTSLIFEQARGMG